MNATECNSLIASVEWTEPRKILLLAILIFIDILVIVGNTLVVAAVTSSHKLRSVTNFFIVSLAVADLLVGLAVLPFSATWEVFKVWIFGDVWCRVWLAVDVWMCTASILNLCAISLDRYVAVTRPVTYPSIMSTRRAKSLIAGLWVLSFVICFPPLVGWKEQEVKENLLLPYGNHTLVSIWEVGGMGETSPNPPPCPWTCELTNDAGYVVYSALGSFYIPMFVMLFFYWRIYRAAERTTRAINQGFRTTKAPAGISRDLSPNSSKKLGKKHLKVQVKRFRMETKAAKTLAIIVGGFIICWLPFFTMYLIRAFCDDCINDTLFSILFWLGYCNSAVNPFIYALFSRDFRQAFKRIIMRCFCWKRFKINLLKKSSTTQHTNNHSYSPSAFTPLASTPRTELDSTVFR
ncbi:AAEL014224-PA [Aedes aegypti]|uniref:AAEL014224-PA n=1 Tax=Aedes aegypti TaxID=7159 RepID=Q16GY1_AEDAE|nr:AAEL014224-PA [Aedes aegypti]